MGIADLFRRKWKHSNPDVRAEAVRDLDDQVVLAQVVRQDGDARVRRIALKKIADPRLLSEVASSDPDESLRKSAAEKRSEILVADAMASGNDEKSVFAVAELSRGNALKALSQVAKRASSAKVRSAAVQELKDPKLLGDVARGSEDPKTRVLAIGRIEDAAILREIVLAESVKEIALTAIGRIQDRAALEAIVAKAKIKAVRQRAKELLGLDDDERPALSKAERDEEKRNRAKRITLVRLVEAASVASDLTEAKKEITAAIIDWDDLGSPDEKDPLRKRFEKSVATLRAREVESEKRERQAAIVAEENERRGKLNAVEEEKRKAEAAIEAAKRAELDAVENVEREKRAVERAERDRARAAEKAEFDKRKTEERAARFEEEAHAVRRLEEMCAALEALATTDDRKRADQTLKIAQSAFTDKSLPRELDALRTRFSAARSNVFARLNELREAEDWKRWANVPKLEQLCIKMENLLERVAGPDSANADLKTAGVELKELQMAWKSAGPATQEKSEALWTRFKQASDEVYAKVRTQLDEERSANLKMKEELCTRVEALAEGPNTKEASDQAKAMQEDWKRIGPVPKEVSDEIWKRFRTACDKLFERRKAEGTKLDGERAANLKKKEDLCVKVEALSESTDWKGAADQIKAAQTEWKSTGAAPRKDADAIWKRFRAACDKFFARRQEHFTTLDSQRDENLKKKETLCEKAEWALAGADVDREDAQKQAKDLMKEWKTLGPVPREQADAVWKRFRDACDQIFGKDEPEEQELDAIQAEDFKFENRLHLEGFLTPEKDPTEPEGGGSTAS